MELSTFSCGMVSVWMIIITSSTPISWYFMIALMQLSGISGYRYAAVGESVAVQFRDGRARRARTGVERYADLLCLLLVLLVRLSQPASEVGPEVVRELHPMPLAIPHMRRPDRRYTACPVQRRSSWIARRVRASLAIVGAAVGVNVVRPVVGNERADRVGVLDPLFVGLDMLSEDGWGVGRR